MAMDTEHDDDFMRLELAEKRGFLACVEGEAKKDVIDKEGVLRIKGREKLPEASSWQKKYADQKVRETEFIKKEQVLLKDSPMKSLVRFGKRGKLSSMYIGPFKVLKRIEEVAYELDLSPGLSGVHLVFYVSMPKKYHGDGNNIIPRDLVLLDGNLSYDEDPVVILDREVRKLRSREIAFVKVRWRNRPIEEST
ncbi:uncharacterized protein LOC129884150 [Solanum dulcamara]|uniref:uncharacterized protein LOC129884150 n=1 Tax=Solanum dulcamara TaxID=45834 RepID=UPI0024862B1C|nr:uncharacterized protein LOC129884150 [Solanum dulcamara]